jgi:MoaA/NifB/PqqE/SkfB family radical SAM enzyme
MPTKLNSKSFCVFPFVQTVIRTDGFMSPCCNIQGKTNIRDMDLKEYWNGDQMSQIRSDMINGVEHIPACSSCYDQEKSTGKSSRTESLLDYKFLNHKYYDKIFEKFEYANKSFPSRVEMHVGNTCNLKCLTCRPQDSSAFLAEDSRLGISKFDQHKYELTEIELNHTLELIFDHDVELIDLRGGESMLIPRIKKILSDLPESSYQKTLRLQTNCTILDDTWKLIFSKFKNVEIMASIDAYGKDNYYIRYPADWKIIENNIDYFQSLPNVKLYVNCTISNLNFLIVDKLIEWCKRKKIYIHYFFLFRPAYYSYTNLPAELFYKAKQKLLKYPELDTMLLNSQPSDKHWQDFCHMITIRDQYRNNNIFEILPELQTWWKK